MSARIVVDPGTLRIGKSGPSTGEIWLSVDGVAFPAIGWNDFAVVIMEAWVAAFLRVSRGITSIERVHFMDGPYEVEIARGHEGALRLRAIERRNTERVRGEVQISVLLADLLAVGDSLVSACQRIGDSSTDARRLQEALADLRIEATTLAN